MLRTGLLFFVVFVIIGCAFAQEDDLQSNRVELQSQINAFGVEEQVLVGNIVNSGRMAYDNVQVLADILDEDGEVIGEGFGFLADQCGEAILDAPLQPEQSRRFLASVDIFEEGEPTDFEITIIGTEVDPEVLPERDVANSIQKVAGGEVVSVEWEDNNTLRYGIGCDESLFTSYDWYRYQISDDIITPLDENPNEEFITDAFLLQSGVNLVTQSGETDPTLIDRAFLTFPTQSSRIVYQNDINHVFTSETDGSFKRLIHTRLSQFTLRRPNIPMQAK
ncbi:MAG: hypothetical protein AAFV93_24630, partial [Chloroflexota bacterium]